MHIAAVMELEEHLLPHAEALANAIETKADEWMEVVKTGRTHLMDAVPLTVGQEWSGWASQIRDALDRIRLAGLPVTGVEAQRRAARDGPELRVVPGERFDEVPGALARRRAVAHAARGS